EDPYGISKYAVELELRELQHMFGIPSIVFRPHNVYGERQNIGDPYRNVIGIFMNQALQRLPLSVFGDGMQTRAFSHVADVAPIIARSVEREAAYNRVFNVGADKPYTVYELATTISELMGVKPEIIHLPARNEVVHAYPDHGRVKAMFSDLIQNV